MLDEKTKNQLTSLTDSSERIHCLYFDYGDIVVSDEQLNIPQCARDGISHVRAKDKLAVVIYYPPASPSIKQYVIINCDKCTPIKEKSYIASIDGKWVLIKGISSVNTFNIVGEVVTTIVHN